MTFIITVRNSQVFQKSLQNAKHRNLTVHSATREVSRCAHTEVLQAVLLYSGNFGSSSPSQRIRKAELQYFTVILSNISSANLPAPPAASFPSLSSSRDIQARGLSPTKYTRLPLTSESSAVRSSRAGDNVMSSRELRVVISPRKKRGRER